MPIHGAYTPYDIERVNRAMLYISNHYTNSISTDHLSIEVNMDKKLLQKMMKAISGLTVHNYQLKIMVDHATEDLSDFKLAVKKIAEKNGFSSSSHFIAQFKRQHGITPTRYRYLLSFKLIPMNVGVHTESIRVNG